MKRCVQFGSGPSAKLPRFKGWENRDRDVNIRFWLPYADSCLDVIYAEHLIEHVPTNLGWRFVGECWRILRPGGVARFAFPDITLVSDPERVRSCVVDWGHCAIWTAATLSIVAKAIGFRTVRVCEYGQSTVAELHNVESHHLGFAVDEQTRIAAETSVLELVR